MVKPMSERKIDQKKPIAFRKKHTGRLFCKTCGNELPKSMFYKSKGYYSAMCRDCTAIEGYKKRPHIYENYVYIVRIDNTAYYKIGKTSDIDNRMEILRYYNPMPMSIVYLHKCNDAGLLEIRLHRIYSRFRRQGEWFELHDFSLPEMKAAIKRLSIG
jgi:transcription elongation factor Elf1